MSEPVMKRHARLAVWGLRAAEWMLPAACAAVAAALALQGQWLMVPYWLVGVIVLVAYEWRLRLAWVSGWDKGRRDTLDRLSGLIDLESPEGLARLQEAYMAEPPTWRQVQDQFAGIDHEATLRASLDELERVFTTTFTPAADTTPTFTCPRCGMTSPSPDDVKYGYCGNCRAFTRER